VLVDEGANAYLHQDGVSAQVPASGTPGYMLGDALGSVRGITDTSGVLTASANYDIFGAVRTSSGPQSVFGFTGEQRDAETGFTYLRARYLDPALGRFTQADTVQPNAPGTQGWTRTSGYVANNPGTWTPVRPLMISPGSS
jgi:RHS repeat-associated protein